MIRYISLAQYVWLAEQVTGIEAAVLAKAARIDLADSALHAPSASFGGEEFYPAPEHREEPVAPCSVHAVRGGASINCYLLQMVRDGW